MLWPIFLPFVLLPNFLLSYMLPRPLAPQHNLLRVAETASPLLPVASDVYLLLILRI
jgi:hypothetical protein